MADMRLAHFAIDMNETLPRYSQNLVAAVKNVSVVFLNIELKSF